MDPSKFDPNSFLDAAITEPSTKRSPIPAGSDLIGTIGEPKSRPWTGKADPSKSGIAIDIPIEIIPGNNPSISALYPGVDRIVLTDGIMLDTTANGGIDNSPGKNGKLRRYREALDMNKPGDSFSFRKMQGRAIRVKTKLEPYEGELYDKVDSVSKV